MTAAKSLARAEWLRLKNNTPARRIVPDKHRTGRAYSEDPEVVREAEAKRDRRMQGLR